MGHERESLHFLKIRDWTFVARGKQVRQLKGLPGCLLGKQARF